MSRRAFLKVGALGFGGLTLPNLLRLRAEGAVPAEKTHKAVIMVFLSGGPSHLDSYDMKPDLPADFAASSSRSRPMSQACRSAS